MIAPRRARGFSLVELIVVIVLIGIIGGVLTMQLLPAIRAYLAVGQRAALTNQADTALRRIVGEVRSAVPNSLRLGSPECMELVPTRDGGRYRTGPDAGDDSGAAAAVDPGAFLEPGIPASQFDVLTTHATAPAPGDAIVIGNQNTDDVYSGANVARVHPATPTVATTTGTLRVNLAETITIPPGYAGGRFVVVPRGRSVVTYRCSPRDQGGNGQLVRIVDAAFHSAPNCAGPLPAGAAILADKVASCAFIYSPNQGATQESGFVQLQLTLEENGESVPLTIGAHVDNMP